MGDKHHSGKKKKEKNAIQLLNPESYIPTNPTLQKLVNIERNCLISSSK